MEYRVLPHGGDKISVLGLGSGSLHNSNPEEIEHTVNHALDAGINLFDFIPTNLKPFEGMARALSPRRKEAFVQVHIGASYETGNYGWTTNPGLAIREFERRLDQLDTDYADFGFIHCVDEQSDVDAIMGNGIWEYACRMKDEGVIRHLAFSTHSVEIARRFLETGVMDWGMFSLNPMYDYTDESQYGKGSSTDRQELYHMFEAHGVGMSVMKPFAGGQLLDENLSPFGQALTQYQCLQYALDKPGVVSVLPGVRNYADLEMLIGFFDVGEEQRDYSLLGTLAPQAREGACVYCNHCQPCPQGIEIGLVNKYYDLAQLGDELAADHYRTLDAHADDCTRCGHCDSRCPFGVTQSSRMTEIANYFGV